MCIAGLAHRQCPKKVKAGWHLDEKKLGGDQRRVPGRRFEIPCERGPFSHTKAPPSGSWPTVRDSRAGALDGCRTCPIFGSILLIQAVAPARQGCRPTAKETSSKEFSHEAGCIALRRGSRILRTRQRWALNGVHAASNTSRCLASRIPLLANGAPGPLLRLLRGILQATAGPMVAGMPGCLGFPAAVTVESSLPHQATIHPALFFDTRPNLLSAGHAVAL